MRHDIHGEFAQYARLEFDAGEACWAGRGAIMSCGPAIDWQMRVPGGVSGAARRMLSGEGLALVRIEAAVSGATAALASNQPGRIFTWDLADGPLITTRGSFLAAWGEIDISISIARRAGAALFGGAGLFLQHVSGHGTVLVHASGDLDDRRLAAGESLDVSTGHLAALTEGTDYDVRFVGGLRKALFSGEGIFMTRLTGPGRVLLQTLKRGQAMARRR
jgi:uncharacterized protein (TIGR00266 family)